MVLKTTVWPRQFFKAPITIVLLIYQNNQFYSIAKVIFEEQASIFYTIHLHSGLQTNEHNKKFISHPKLMLWVLNRTL